MNFSAGRSLLTDLVLKNLGSATVIPIYDTMISVQWLSEIITHTGKPLIGISPIGMESMFSEYILGHYLTLI